MTRPVSIAVAGVGGWGKNLVRNFHQMPDADLKYLCDVDETRLGQTSAQHPGIAACNDFDTLLADPALECIAIATSAVTHFTLARNALLAGKDVFVEKPFVLDVGEARELIALARQHKRVLMVGHLLEYHPVIEYLKDCIDEGRLGRILYAYSQRLNLGVVRGDENALWSFAPHDVSVILYLLGKYPTQIAAYGQSYLQSGIEDVAFITMQFSDAAMAHAHVSWLDPHKVRRLTIVGTRKMAVFDDLEPNEKLKIYDNSDAADADYDTFAEYVGLRFGDINIPSIRMSEPLRIECSHFLDCVRERKQPRSDGEDGLRVVRVLAAAERSLKSGGVPVDMDDNA